MSKIDKVFNAKLFKVKLDLIRKLIKIVISVMFYGFYRNNNL